MHESKQENTNQTNSLDQQSFPRRDFNKKLAAVIGGVGVIAGSTITASALSSYNLASKEELSLKSIIEGEISVKGRPFTTEGYIEFTGKGIDSTLKNSAVDSPLPVSSSNVKTNEYRLYLGPESNSESVSVWEITENSNPEVDNQFTKRTPVKLTLAPDTSINPAELKDPRNLRFRIIEIKEL